MNLRLILIILFSTVNPVDLLLVTSGTVAEALLVLWKECNLAKHAPVGTRSAIIQASGYTMTYGPPVNVTKFQIDFETEDILMGIWTNDPYYNESSFVLWDSTGVPHTIQFFDRARLPFRRAWRFDVPIVFLGTPQWRFMLIKGDHLLYVVNNGTGYRKKNNKPAISIGQTPLLDAHYSYSAPTDTVYIFNQANCLEIKDYSSLGAPFGYAKSCDPSSGGFHHRSPSTDFQWLAYVTKSCKYEKFTALDTYPMAYVNFSNDPVWSHDMPRPTFRPSSSIVTLASTPAQTTTVSNGTKSDIGMPVGDVFVKQEFVLLHRENENDTPGAVAVSVIGPIVAIIFLCLAGVLGVFIITLQHEKKKKKLGSQLESQTSPISMLTRFMGFGKKTSKPQSRTEERDEDNPDVEHSDLPTGKPKTSTQCSSTPLITPMSTKKTQQTSKGTPSMVPQGSKDRRLRKHLPSGSRSHGSPADVDGTSTSKNKTASKNTKNKRTGPIPSMVPYDSRHFKKNLPSASRVP